MPTNTADIRQYLTSSYSDEELITLCADYFRDVYDNFAVGMTKTAKIQLLLDHCQRRDLMPNLLAALERDRPDQYRKRCGPAAVELTPVQPPQGRDPRQVFISHAHEDAEFARRLAADLDARGWRVWIAPDSIRPGEKWAEAIDRGLEECGVFVVALTPAAVQSEWVKTETNLAIELQHQGEMRFIPLEVVGCRIPLLWTAYQRVSFTGRYEHGWAKLLAELEGISTAAEAPASKPAAPKIKLMATWRVGMSPDLLTMTFPIRMELVRVPAGEFLMGSDPKVDKNASANEQPQHRLYLPEFYIGRVPVTNAQYAVFVKATRHRAPEGYGNEDFLRANKAEHPVINVSWDDAANFCRWLSKATGRSFRLPSEAEWEKAAQGSDGRIYPWGNEPPVSLRFNFGDPHGGTTPVRQYPDGVSPCGLLDMAGNVWDRTLSWRWAYPYQEGDGRNSPEGSGLRVLRGGSFFNDAQDVRCAVRGGSSPVDRFVFVGFRVATPGS